MGKWGKVDYKQIQDLQKRLNKMQKGNVELFIEECAKELAARLLAKVIKRTVVGIYPVSSGKKGGTLRRGWTSKTEEEAAGKGKTNVKAYVDSLVITKVGNAYQIEIVNPVYYASYKEYGHRTPDHKGWVKGDFMLTISEAELDSQAPEILENKIMKYLGGMF
jgi:hypothetical protein